MKASTRESGSLPAFVILGMFVVALSIQATDAKAERAAIADDAQAMATACQALSHQTDESRLCYRQCSVVTLRKSTQSRKAALSSEKQGSACNDAYAAVDFDAIDTSTPPSTIEVRIAAMPPKGEYCSTQMAGRKLKGPDTFFTPTPIKCIRPLYGGKLPLIIALGFKR